MKFESSTRAIAKCVPDHQCPALHSMAALPRNESLYRLKSNRRIFLRVPCCTCVPSFFCPPLCLWNRQAANTSQECFRSSSERTELWRGTILRLPPRDGEQGTTSCGVHWDTSCQNFDSTSESHGDNAMACKAWKKRDMQTGRG